MSELRVLDRAAKAPEEAIGNMAEDEITHEIALMPTPGPNGVGIGLMLLVLMPTPAIGGNEKFVCQWASPELLFFEREGNARQVIFDMVSQLRAQKAEWLRGAN